MSEASGKRILVLSNIYPPTVLGGYEVECSGVVAELKHKHEVLVLTSWKGRRAAGREEGVVRRLPFVPHRRWYHPLSPLFSIIAGAATRRALREFKPDVVYVWNGAQVPQAAIRLMETSGATVAYRICEHWFGALYDSDPFMQGLMGKAWKRLMRALNALPMLRVDVERPVDVAVCWNSEMVRREAQPPRQTTNVALERVVIPATQQSEEFVDLPRAPAQRPTIGFVGRVSPEKGIEVVIRALAELRDQHGLDVEFDVAGTGPASFQRELDRLVAELGLGERVRFLGRRDPAGLKELFSSWHAMVVPSTWAEPAPLVIIEGALARVPLVVSEVGGIPEMVRDPQEALLVAPGESSAWAEALRRTLTEATATESRVEGALERVQAFRIGRYHEALEEFIEAAIARGAT